MPSARPASTPPALRSPATSPPRAADSSPSRSLSFEEEEEARAAAVAPAKPQGFSLEEIWPKVKLPAMAAGGLAVVGGVVALFLSPVVQRPLTVTMLRFGWAKNAQGQNLAGVDLQKSSWRGLILPMPICGMPILRPPTSAAAT
ncbi:MAG: hypothetical protein HC918_13100 [Oscillatoriales cyanobacterium SM2_1_8]|nr:hypothetical protein [Oscillatoriales cyanobacterium SM2_1_8]